MFTSQEGKKVPQVTFHTRQGDQWIDVTTNDLFKDKTVIVFSLPGAFTPTEVLTAWEAGADIVKVFPADVLGPAFFRAMRGPLRSVFSKSRAWSRRLL